jgi:hypothetical protein
LWTGVARALSPDVHLGLRDFRVAAVPASAPAGRDPHTSPERKRRDSGPLGETGIDDLTAGPAARSKSMDDGIRSGAVSPDWRRGLLWAFQARRRRPGVPPAWQLGTELLPQPQPRRRSENKGHRDPRKHQTRMRQIEPSKDTDRGTPSTAQPRPRGITSPNGILKGRITPGRAFSRGRSGCDAITPRCPPRRLARSPGPPTTRGVSPPGHHRPAPL